MVTCIAAYGFGRAPLLWTLASHSLKSIALSTSFSLAGVLIGFGEHQQSLKLCMLHNCIAC